MRKIFATSCDGVLLDFSTAYAEAYERVFGQEAPLTPPPRTRYELIGSEDGLTDREQAVLTSEFWAAIPPLANSLDACQQLDAAGFDIYVVTALPYYHVADRFANLVNEGFPIKDILATDSYTFGEVSPKAEAIASLRPLAFADSYISNFKGIPRSGTHAALINSNRAELLPGMLYRLVDSSHDDLLKFVDWWLNGAGSF